jgi:hypothetical protein
LTISTGSGDDQLQLDRVSVRGAMQVDTGAGDDRLQIANSQIRSAVLDGGRGRDTLQITDTLFASLPTLLNWEEIL